MSVTNPGRSLSYLISRSALTGQMFAIVSLISMVLISFFISSAREKKQICARAQLTWQSNQEKILGLLMLGESKGAQLKIAQILEDGGWSRVVIKPLGAGTEFHAVTVGEEQGLIQTCTAEFSYLEQLHGLYQFEYPLKSFWIEMTKLAVALVAVLCGLFLIIFFQKKIIRKNILEPIGEIRNNLRGLSRGTANVSFLTQPECEELRELQSSIELAFNQNKRLRDDLEGKKIIDEINKVSMQVAHDIRSPLASLDMILEGLAQLPEEKRVQIRSAVSRIRDIANTLLKKARETSEKSTELGGRNEEALQAGLSIQLVSTLVDSLVSEKRLQYRARIGVHIDAKLDSASYGLFVKIDPSEFKSILSNLINNSVEAIQDAGRIDVSVTGSPRYVTITVGDNGKGIPKDVLPKLTGLGQTYGKENGSGLGLYHARSKVEAWDGKLEVESQEGRGATVSIALPRAMPPDWFVCRLELPANSAVVILDDDASIHQVWERRLDLDSVREKGIQLAHLSNPSAFRAWVRNGHNGASDTVYLVDYELVGHPETGLDLICELGIEKQAILVTSHYEEKALLSRCRLAKVRLIPKGMAGFVPISLVDKRTETCA